MVDYVVVLFTFLLSQCLGVDFQGGLMTFTPIQRHKDGNIMVSFHYKEFYRGNCQHQFTWSCTSGDCGHVIFSEVADTDKDNSDLRLWCQSEGIILRNVSSNQPFSLRETGCCWLSNVGGVSNWTLTTLVDTGTRSDMENFNTPPVMTTIPTIRVPQNCISDLPFLAHDPDGDEVRCVYSNIDCNLCNQKSNFILNEQQCRLQISNTPSLGVYVFMLVVEDYPNEEITLSYTDGTSSVRSPLNFSMNSSIPLSQLPLHFSVEIQPPLSTCSPGVVIPQFLSPTPFHGDVLYATVGYPLELILRAQAAASAIYDFQISGPRNMTKSFFNYTSGVAQIQVNWMPQEVDRNRHVPVCFTAETKISQSEIRCIVVVVTKSVVVEGETDVSCLENTITITIKKSSLRGVDDSQLQLKDPSCSLTSNETHVMGIISINSCGTQLQDGGDDIIFRNEIDSVELTDSVITRAQPVKILFSCRYPKISHVFTSFNIHKSEYVFTEYGFGTFSYSMEFYTDNMFTTKIEPGSYPVEVQLLDMIFVSIQAHSALPQAQLFVESCRATPDDNPNNLLYYDVITNGCYTDDTIVVYQTNETSFSFQIQAFKFSGDFEQVYISCMVILCEANNPGTRCSQGCVKSSERRRRQQPTVETDQHYISQGPLHFVKSDLSDNGFNNFVTSNVSTRIFAGVFVFAILILAVVVAYKVMKNKPISHNALLSSF